MSSRIEDLTPATTLSIADLIEIEQGGATFQAAMELIGGLALRSPGGRLTTESGVPISTSDRTSQGTLYYTPYISNRAWTYDGSAWRLKTFPELSLALTLTSGKNYDVFANNAMNALSLSSAWTNDTTRADALATQDGVTVLSSDHTKLWLGTIRASGSNVTEDSEGGTVNQTGGKRFVWNAYNQVTRRAAVIDTAANWTYTTATVRQAHGAAGNKIEYVTGFSTEIIDAMAVGAVGLGSNTVVAAQGVGVDSTTTFAGLTQTVFNGGASVVFSPVIGRYNKSPGLGYHFISWNEVGADNTCTFTGQGTAGGATVNSGLVVLLNC